MSGRQRALSEENHTCSNSRKLETTTVLTPNICKPCKVRCSGCEIMFNAKVGDGQQEMLCADCMKGKLPAHNPTDFIYPENFKSSLVANKSNINNSSTPSKELGPKRMLPSQKKTVDYINKKPRLFEGKFGVKDSKVTR